MDVPTTTQNPLFVLNPPTRQQYADYCWFEGIFSFDDVQRIIALAEEFPPEEATVGNDRTVDAGIRSSTVRWVHPSMNSAWLFERIASIVTACNNERYGFDLWGLREGLQVAEYRPGGFFSWHKDHGNADHSVRKLSITIQLSDAAEYEGGEMEFHAGPQVQVAPKTRGTAIIFPAFVMHRVTPLTRGTRRSVVGWFSGPPYR